MIHARPEFENPDAYCRHIARCLDHDIPPWEPATRGELAAALEEFPQLRPRFLPVPETMRLMGLRLDHGRQPKAVGDHLQERILQTLKSDRAFAQAVVNLLKEAAA